MIASLEGQCTYFRKWKYLANLKHKKITMHYIYSFLILLMLSFFQPENIKNNESNQATQASGGGSVTDDPFNNGN
ncbi:MAG: hypothetical protein R8G66_22065 [Cytophagales bacterium]|nr:hypothetical protein [Cytophagales bacterium]